MVRVRIPRADGPLRPVRVNEGFVAGLPIPEEGEFGPTLLSDAVPSNQNRPWFPDAELARESRHMAAINWQADSQMPAFANGRGEPIPMTYQGITSPVPVATDADGISFTLRGCLLPAIPSGFVGAGETLRQAPGEPTVEWICGSVAPDGSGRFRIALDRTWPHGPICVAVRHRGTSEIRDVVQPGYIKLTPNSAGAAQAISFAAIADQVVGTTTVPLVAQADSGLPVRFFVVAGPATVTGSTLQLTAVPPRTRLPVEITVTAWQWGRSAAPSVQTAQPVTRSFWLRPKPTPRAAFEN